MSMKRLILCLLLCIALPAVAQIAEPVWLPPSVNLDEQTATFYLPDLPAGMVIDHAVVVRDGQEIGPASGNLDLGLLSYDCEIWVRVYLKGHAEPMDGPHLILKVEGGRKA